MTRYELIIYWSKDDDSFVVEVPELAGWSLQRAERMRIEFFSTINSQLSTVFRRRPLQCQAAYYPRSKKPSRQFVSGDLSRFVA
jgi:hypothetical protein